MSTVLVVDDDRALRHMVRAVLERDGHEVIEAEDGRAGIRAVHAFTPDVVVLDLSMPAMDGLTVLGRIREFTSTPVVILTARDAEADTVRALRDGADDYVTKPFRNAELAARVASAARRATTTDGPAPGAAAASHRMPGGLQMDLDRREVWVDGRDVTLTPREYAVLAVLIGTPSRAFSRQDLLDRVWGEGWFGDDHLVDVTISKLRAKLGDDARHPRFVETVRGVGFRAFRTQA